MRYHEFRKLTLLPMGSSIPTLPEPVRVAFYQPDLNCGMSKFRMLECDPNECIVQSLIGGHPPRSPQGSVDLVG